MSRRCLKCGRALAPGLFVCPGACRPLRVYAAPAASATEPRAVCLSCRRPTSLPATTAGRTIEVWRCDICDTHGTQSQNSEAAHRAALAVSLRLRTPAWVTEAQRQAGRRGAAGLKAVRSRKAVPA